MAEAKILKGETKKVQTGRVRLSYAHLFERYEKSGKYQCQLLIPKDDKAQLDVIRKAIENAKADGKERLWGNKMPGGYRSPLNDGDAQDESQEAQEGCYFINAKSNSRPYVHDTDGTAIEPGDFDASERIYSGCYVRAIISFYPYNNEGKGVAAALERIQKLGDGETLGGGSRSDFEDDDEKDELLD